MEDVVKIYDSANFSKLVQGIKVVQTSKIENFQVQIAISNLPSDIVEPTQSETLTCSFCKVNFTDYVQQRQHYKSDWHRYNLKQNLKSQDPITEEGFEQLADDVSSISGSDSERDDIAESTDIEGNQYAVYRGKIFFENDVGKVFSLYRCLLYGKKDSPSDEKIPTLVRNCGTNLQWTILMLGGGHFAGAVFDGSDVKVHKTFHCYTVRAKQGGAQGSRDNRSGSNIKSAGASLRRYNEQALIQHVGEILQAWESYIENSNLIFYRAAGPYNRSVLFGGKNPVLKKNDNRLRTIPFSTRRPTYTELCRVYDLLMSLDVYGSIECIKNQFEKQKEEQMKIMMQHGSRRESPRNKNINRAKSRETKERPLPMTKQETSSESETDEECKLITEENEISMSDLQQFEDTVPESIKIKKNQQKKKRVKKKDKIKEVNANLKKQLYDACNKGQLETIKEIVTSVKENEYNEDGQKEAIDLLNACLDEHGNMALHVAAMNGNEQIITWLMENEASPCNRNDKLQTPYTINVDKNVRNVFRTFALENPEKYNYAKSQIPIITSALTEEEQSEKRKAQRKAKREREKEKKKENELKKKEAEDKERFVQLSDREKRALAAERRILSQSATSKVLARCFLCGEDITGKVPLEYNGNRFCTIDCLKAHRMKNTVVLS